MSYSSSSSSGGSTMTMPYRSSQTSATNRLTSSRLTSTYSSAYNNTHSTFSSSTRPGLTSYRQTYISADPISSHYPRDKEDYRSIRAKTTNDLNLTSSGISRSYTRPRSQVSSLRGYGSSATPSSSSSSKSLSTEEVTGDPQPSVDELRRRFEPSRSVHNLNNPASANTNPSAVSAASEKPKSETDSSDGLLDGGSADSDSDSSLPRRSLHTVSSSSKSSTEKSGLNGLRNIGNTCFMNSVIQCLSNTKPLLEYLVDDEYLSDINMTVSSMRGALIKAFANVVQELWAPNAEDKIINTSSFKSQIQRFAPRFMGYAQQDAQEFLRYLLEGLHEDVNRVESKPKPITTDIEETLSDNQKANESWDRYLRMDNSKIMDIFVGQLKSTLQCTVCGHCSVTFDPFWDLSLPLPSRSGTLKLQACLDMFAKEEVLDGDEKPTCSKCQTRRKCTKKFSIQKFPKILVLHLKRFSPTERFRGKLSNCVEFPLTGLDMSPYVAGKGMNCLYNLYAVSNHSGTTYGGHYTAYCQHPYTKAWHEYNDSRVSSLPTRSIVSYEAYVLFYQLCSQTSHL